MVKILVKKFYKNIKLPVYKTPGSSGMDLVAYIKNKITIDPGKTVMIPTGIAVAIPKNYEIQIRPRSGLAASMRRRKTTMVKLSFAKDPKACGLAAKKPLLNSKN